MDKKNVSNVTVELSLIVLMKKHGPSTLYKLTAIFLPVDFGC